VNLPLIQVGMKIDGARDADTTVQLNFRRPACCCRGLFSPLGHVDADTLRNVVPQLFARPSPSIGHAPSCCIRRALPGGEGPALRKQSPRPEAPRNHGLCLSFMGRSRSPRSARNAWYRRMPCSSPDDRHVVADVSDGQLALRGLRWRPSLRSRNRSFLTPKAVVRLGRSRE
jgi:hypothetical protein